VYRENTSRTEPAELQSFLEGMEKFTIPRCPELVENKAIPACLRVASVVVSFSCYLASSTPDWGSHVYCGDRSLNAFRCLSGLLPNLKG